MSNRTWFWVVSLAVQAVLTLAWRLAQNAMLGWGDDQVGALLGITSPALSTVAAWTIPFLLAAATLWGFYLYLKNQWSRNPTVAIHTIGSPRGEVLESIISQIPRHLYAHASNADRVLGTRVLVGWLLIVICGVGLIVGIGLLVTTKPSPAVPFWNFARPDAPAKPPEVPQKPQRRYSSADIPKLTPVLQRISDVVTAEGTPLSAEIYRFSNNLPQNLNELGTQGMLHQVQAYADLANSFGAKIDDIQTQAGYYQEEVNYIINAKGGNVAQSVAQEIANTTRWMGGIASPPNSAGFSILNTMSVQFRSKANEFHEWTAQTSKRIQEIRKDLYAAQ
jgi:hypothetical protein